MTWDSGMPLTLSWLADCKTLVPAKQFVSANSTYPQVDLRRHLLVPLDGSDSTAEGLPP